ncbi:MAG: MFS family permease [Candidatus Poriferisodalaceae bacterium]
MTTHTQAPNTAQLRRDGLQPWHVVIIAGSLILMITGGIRSSFALLIDPLTDATGGPGLTKSQVGLGLAIQQLMWGLGQPITGGLADRFGSGRVLAIGGALYIGGLIAMSNVTTAIQWQLSAGLLIGSALAGASISVVLASVGRAAPAERRSLALGLTTASMSLGQFIMVPVMRGLIDRQDWDGALVTMAFIVSTVIVVSYWVRGKAVTGDGSLHASQTLREAISEAAAHRSFVLLTLGFFVCGFHVAFIGVYLPSHITDIGLSKSTGSLALGLIGLFNIGGSITAGVMGAKRNKALLLTNIYLGRAIVIAAFVLLPASTMTTLVFAAVMGLFWLSTVPLTSGLVAQMFGPQHVGALFGLVFLSHQMGSFIGVYLGGWVFDQTDSYDAVWWLAAALGVIAAILHWPIGSGPVEVERLSEQS